MVHCFSSCNNNLFSLFVLLSLCIIQIKVVQCEKREFNVILYPDASAVHYSEGYLIAPGVIDLSHLTFQTSEPKLPTFNWPLPLDGGREDDDVVLINGGDGDDDDDELEGEDDDDDSVLHDDDDGTRYLAVNDSGGKGNPFFDVTVIDIAILHLPSSCANSNSGCDWTELGIGATTPDGDTRWCCAGDAVALGLCNDGTEHYGKLILNENYKGTHRFVDLPSPKDGQGAKQIVPKSTIIQSETGKYVVIFANCNDLGREVLVEGYTVWKSKHGYLPGELFDSMYFYVAIAIVYSTLFFFYLISMKRNQESRIDIEKWIFGTILMGLIETVACVLDYFYWNEVGTRLLFSVFCGVFIGVLKRSVSRCLAVMVSMGWGVSRDTLGCSLKIIIVLGMIYFGLSAVRDFMITIAVEEEKTLSLQEEFKIFDMVEVLTHLINIINFIFLVWIITSMCRTMSDLRRNNQMRKFKRYQSLLSIFALSMIVSFANTVFTLYNSYDEDGVLEIQHEWIIDAINESNYLFVLTGVAFLWWPNPSAKEYAYVMELPSNFNDDDDDEHVGEHELELTDVVPSAAEDDDDKIMYETHGELS